MLTTRIFLAEECLNIKRLLDDTLRHAYGSAKSEEFYKECRARLRSLSAQVDVIDEANLAEIHTLAIQIHILSDKITKIERSHIGELSWPFALVIKEMALEVCRENVAAANEEDPLFFFSANGGMFVYAVSPERAAALSRRRIFNVVFPRSFKYQVLLHTILGHEIGHVAYAYHELRHELETKVTSVLLDGSPFTSTSDFKDWLEKTYKLNLGDPALNDAFARWRQEYFCDLFGLLIMGPSFLPAYRSLFHLLDHTGSRYSATHPPIMSRYSMLQDALSFLSWEKWEGIGHQNLRQPLNSMYEPMRQHVSSIPAAMRILDHKQVESATTALKDILKRMGDTLYVHPNPDELSEILSALLNGTPAICTKVKVAGRKLKRRYLVNHPIDFRHILFAGWLAVYHDARDKEELSLFKINRLCDRSILHQDAINTWTEHFEKELVPKNVSN
jgi:hypothetical protein